MESVIQILHDLQPKEQSESILGEMSLDAYAAFDCDVITTSMPDESMVPATVESENDLDTETDPLQFCPKAADVMMKTMIREALATGELRLMDMAIKHEQSLNQNKSGEKQLNQLSIADFFKRQ